MAVVDVALCVALVLFLVNSPPVNYNSEFTIRKKTRICAFLTMVYFGYGSHVFSGLCFKFYCALSEQFNGSTCKRVNP